MIASAGYKKFVMMSGSLCPDPLTGHNIQSRETRLGNKLPVIMSNWKTIFVGMEGRIQGKK